MGGRLPRRLPDRQTQEGAAIMNWDEMVADYYSRLGFTQRDLDPLGRGDAAQLTAAEVVEHRAEHPGSDGLGYGRCVECSEMWPCHVFRAYAQASDQAKCDENVLRSAGR
jgi:hypothetical protein